MTTEKGCEFCGLAENCGNYKIGYQAAKKEMLEMIKSEKYTLDETAFEVLEKIIKRIEKQEGEA